ncbi:TPA: hypothetical protein NJ344_003659 [Vibrio parahaemolyticus]|uniref:hypothetical protein n=1 Tax=Vibrio parahaemolyticus TaxID=670 RepID=UPI00236126D2|nr:hypothetical protein [Vibrio parahaemolyticus]EHR1014054.1 hypothetical protein [Vibrio parahaemolyticus]HCG7125468.1 hypothetical protein [Vibrio parahaemolyticus]
MIDLKMTVNGKPFNKANLDNEILNAVVEGIKENVISFVSPEEASLIEIEITGDEFNSLSLTINGRDDIVAKIEAELSKK